DRRRARARGHALHRHDPARQPRGAPPDGAAVLAVAADARTRRRRGRRAAGRRVGCAALPRYRLTVRRTGKTEKASFATPTEALDALEARVRELAADVRPRTIRGMGRD